MHDNDNRLGPAGLGYAPRVDAIFRVLEAARGQLGSQLHQVEASGEVLAMSEDHCTAQLFIAFELTQRQRQVSQHCAVERVTFPGPVQANKEQMAALLAGNSTWAATPEGWLAYPLGEDVIAGQPDTKMKLLRPVGVKTPHKSVAFFTSQPAKFHWRFDNDEAFVLIEGKIAITMDWSVPG